MGYDSIIFLDPVNEHLTCAICFGPFDEATVCCTNGHVFCKGCLLKASNQTKCPTCRVERSILTPNRPINNMVESLKVKCCAGSDDAPAAKKPKTDEESCEAQATECQWEGTLAMWKAEHERVCPLVHVSCPLKCGTKKILRKDVGQHLTVCDKREVECDLCGEMIEHGLLDRHKNRGCPKAMVGCEFCAQQMTREELGKKGYCPMQEFDDVPCDEDRKHTGHYSTCPKMILHCEFYQRGCKAEFAREDAAKHHAENAQYHAVLVDKTIDQLYSWLDWDVVELTFMIKKQLLRGSSHKTFESDIESTLSSYKLFLKLDLKGPNDAVKAAICSRGSNAPSIYSQEEIELKKISLKVCDTFTHDPTEYGKVEMEEKSLKNQGGGAFELSTTLKNRDYDEEMVNYNESTLTRAKLVNEVNEATYLDVFAVRAYFCIKKTNSAILYARKTR